MYLKDVTTAVGDPPRALLRHGQSVDSMMYWLRQDDWWRYRWAPFETRSMLYGRRRWHLSHRTESAGFTFELVDMQDPHDCGQGIRQHACRPA